MKRLGQFKRVLAQVLTVALLIQPVSVSAAVVEETVVTVSGDSVSGDTVSDDTVSGDKTDKTEEVVEVVTTLNAKQVAYTLTDTKKGKLTKGITVSALEGETSYLTVPAKTKVVFTGAFKLSSADAKYAKAAKAKVKTVKKTSVTTTTVAPKAFKGETSYTVTFESTNNAATKVVVTVVDIAGGFKNYKKVVLGTVSGANGKAVDGVITATNGVESMIVRIPDKTSQLNGSQKDFNKVTWDVKIKKGASYKEIENGAAVMITPEAGAKGSAKVKAVVNGKKYSVVVKFANKAFKNDKALTKQNTARDLLK